jgi:hypothetical protein
MMSAPSTAGASSGVAISTARSPEEAVHLDAAALANVLQRESSLS